MTSILVDAIKNRDLRKEDTWNKTLLQLKEDGIRGDIALGLDRLYAAAETGDWYYPLYSETEIAEDESRRGVNLVRFSSNISDADKKPFILLIPGGGFVNVWSLTEGWPVAAQFNRLGYHVFILSYQVGNIDGLLDKNMETIARALRFINENERRKYHRNFQLFSSRIRHAFSSAGIRLWEVATDFPAEKFIIQLLQDNQ